MTSGIHYEYVDVQLNRAARTVTLTVTAPESVKAEHHRSRSRSGSELVAAADGPRIRRRDPYASDQ